MFSVITRFSFYTSVSAGIWARGNHENFQDLLAYNSELNIGNAVTYYEHRQTNDVHFAFI